MVEGRAANSLVACLSQAFGAQLVIKILQTRTAN